MATEMATKMRNFTRCGLNLAKIARKMIYCHNDRFIEHDTKFYSCVVSSHDGHSCL